MKKTAHIGLGILKLLGLIVLVMVINGIPMLFLAKGQNLPIYTEILLVLAYLVLVFLLSALYGEDTKHISQKTSKFCRFLGEILEKPCYSF